MQKRSGYLNNCLTVFIVKTLIEYLRTYQHKPLSKKIKSNIICIDYWRPPRSYMQATSAL